ncbi:MAG: hypothetical protein ACOY6K_10030 [Pseudomonadota bacterium]
MKSLYCLLRERCGLSIREAASFHDVPNDTVVSWSSGRRNAPAGVIAELRELHATIERAATHGVKEIETLISNQHPESIEIGIAADDHEAQQLGFPCVGAQAAALGRIAALVDVPIRIVPRGSTAPTAAAADSHDRDVTR